jgi:hypothetical protein
MVHLKCRSSNSRMALVNRARNEEQKNDECGEWSLDAEGHWQFTEKGQPIRGATGERRAKITGYSASARLRMLRALLSVQGVAMTGQDEGGLQVERVFFVTLTFPKNFPSPRDAKVFFQTWEKRLRRAFPGCSAFWKLEPQRRGAPHFHLMLFMPAGWQWSRADGSRMSVADLRHFSAQAWFEIAGGGDEKHLRWHHRPLSFQVMKSWRGVSSYGAKYIGKVIDHEAWGDPGRFWGIIGRRFLPRDLVEQSLQGRQLVVLRRACFAWHKRQQIVRVGPPKLAADVLEHMFPLEDPCSKRWDVSKMPAWKAEKLENLFPELVERKVTRRWRRSRSKSMGFGLTAFMPSETFAKLLFWVLETVPPDDPGAEGPRL